MTAETRAAQFAATARRHGVLDEDGEIMTEEEALRAIEAVCDRQAEEDGRYPNISSEQVWSWVEALVLDRFGYDADAFEGVVLV